MNVLRGFLRLWRIFHSIVRWVRLPVRELYKNIGISNMSLPRSHRCRERNSRICQGFWANAFYVHSITWRIKTFNHSGGYTQIWFWGATSGKGPINQAHWEGCRVFDSSESLWLEGRRAGRRDLVGQTFGGGNLFILTSRPTGVFEPYTTRQFVSPVSLGFNCKKQVIKDVIVGEGYDFRLAPYG